MFDNAPNNPLAAAPVSRCAVMLCTYNEAENLPQIFELLGRCLPDAEILVVDDNSPDGTSDVVRQWSLDFPSQAMHLLRQKGAARRQHACHLGRVERGVAVEDQVELAAGKDPLASDNTGVWSNHFEDGQLILRFVQSKSQSSFGKLKR